MFSTSRSAIAKLGLFGTLSILSFTLIGFAQGPDPAQLFREAQEAQQRGDAALAAGKYQELIRLRPELTVAHANLGVVLASLGRFDEAITQYNIALAEAPGDPELRLDLGLAYYKKDDIAGAAAEFALLHKDDPGNVRIATLLGNCQVQLGLIAQAIALLEPLEKANSDNLDLEWALGSAMILADRAREGVARVQKVAEQGHSAEAYQVAAKLYLGLTYYDEARRDAEAVIRLNPQISGAYVVLGMVDDYGGDEKGAQEQFEKALQIDANNLQARIQLGSVLYTQRELDAAHEQLDRVLTQDPKSYAALYLLGRVERAQGNLAAAVKDLEKAARENPPWLLPHVELTALYYQLKRPSDGAREKEIVDRLTAEERQRHDGTRIILPRVPLP
jgi:tetratricopeptide (TPR) repeat protein